jgi:hypothetical protein
MTRIFREFIGKFVYIYTPATHDRLPCGRLIQSLDLSTMDSAADAPLAPSDDPTLSIPTVPGWFILG